MAVKQKQDVAPKAEETVFDGANAENEVELTDAEHALLVNRLRSHRWRVIVPEILQFCQDVATAPEIEHDDK